MRITQSHGFPQSAGAPMDSDILFSLKAPLLLLHLRSAAGALEESWEEQQSSTVTLAALSKVDQQIMETRGQSGPFQGGPADRGNQSGPFQGGPADCGDQ